MLVAVACALLVVAWRRERNHDAAATILAREARARLKALSELAAALSEPRTRAQLAEVVVEHATRTAGADTCTLHVLSDGGDALELVGQRGCAPDVLDRIRRITRTSGNPAAFAAVESRDSTWAESDADYA